jgi:triosephosphate isomerase
VRCFGRLGLGLALDETDEMVSKKACAALKEELNVVICVGESERDANGSYFEFLKNQIRESCKGIQRRQLSNLLIAYEPLWVIGKSWKEAMTPDNIHETVIFIRKTLSDMFDQASAESVAILYGGSVEPENTSEVLKTSGVSGILVGHKSLVIEDFIKMLKSANEV